MKIHYIGDSLTWGLFALPFPDAAYRNVATELLQAQFPDRTWEGSYGIGGTLSNAFAASVGINANAINPDIVVMEIGIHDAMGDTTQGAPPGGTPPAIFKTGYETLLSQICANNHRPLMIFLSLWKSTELAQGPAYDVILDAEASARGGYGIFVDTTDFWLDPTTCGPAGIHYDFVWTNVTDDFHPNAKGHDLLANAICDAIAATGYYNEGEKIVAECEETDIINVPMGWDR